MLNLPLLFTLISTILLLYRYVIYPAFVSPLSKIPAAHFTAPVSSVWIRSKRRNGKTGIQSIFAAHKRLGPIVQLSPNELSVASLDGLRQIYTGAFEKTAWYSELANLGVPNLVSMLKNKPHSVRKRMLSHIYSRSYIGSSTDLHELSRVLIVERLLPVLQKAAESAEPFDAYSLNQALGADFMTSYLFGIGNSTDFIRNVEARKETMQNYRTKTRGLPGKEKASRELDALILSLCESAGTSSQKALSDASSYPVVYSQLSARLSNSESPLPNHINLAVASEMIDHFGAGIESARITLTYIQWELSRDSELQAQLRSELLTIQPLLSLRSEANLPNYGDIDGLPLLEAIVKEIIRVYPPSPALLPRVTPRGGAVIEGYTIPGGIEVGASAHCMHRNPSVFPSPSTFDPFRWLDKDEEKRREMDRWWWGFGSGARMCLGSHFATYMLKVLILAIYSKFQTEIVDDEGIEQEDTFLAGPKGETLVLTLRKVEAVKE
jgi:cytochrome P450